MNGEMEELTEEEKERRKQEQIQYRTRQKTTNVFMFWSTILNVIVTFALVIILLVVFSVIALKLLPLSDEVKTVVFNAFSIVALLGGIVLGFKINKMIGRGVINKWNLKDKLRDEVLNQYKTRDEYETTIKNKKTR